MRIQKSNIMSKFTPILNTLSSFVNGSFQDPSVKIYYDTTNKVAQIIKFPPTVTDCQILINQAQLAAYGDSCSSAAATQMRISEIPTPRSGPASKQCCLAI